MIPSFAENGNLPPGIHIATLQEIRDRFVYNHRRRVLFEKLEMVLSMLRKSNCPEVYLDGSYVTSKENPNDYDMCWEPTGVRATEELRFLLGNPNLLRAQYLGDIRPRLPHPPYQIDHVLHWQTDIDGNAKGIIKIGLRQQQ